MPRGKVWKRVLLISLAAIAFVMVVGLSIGAIYKKEIVALVNDKLQAALHTSASIGDADITLLTDFPNITLLLKDVSIGGDSVPHREFLKASRIHLNLRTFRLLFGAIEFRSVRLQDADIYIFRTTSGFSNTDIFRNKDTVRTEGPTQLQIDRQRLILENCRVAYHDSLKAKFYDVIFRRVDVRLVNEDSLMSATLKGPVDFGGLTFNKSQGAFLHNISLTLDLDVAYHRDSSVLEIRASRASAPALQVAISGKVKLSQPRHLHLRFSTEEVEYDKGTAVLADTLRAKLSKLNITGPTKVEVDLNSDLIPGVRPAADVRFSLQNNRLTGSKLDVTNISLKGHFTNHVNDSLPFNNANSVITLSEVEGEIDGLPFRAEAKLIDPDDFRLEIHSIHSFPLEKLNNQADTAVLRFHGGSFTSEFRYEGKLNEYLDPGVAKFTGNLEGTTSIKDGSFTMVGRKLKFTNLHTTIQFTEDSVLIKSLGVKSGKSSVEVNGTVLNYVPLFVQPEGKGFVRLNINSPYVDMGSLLAGSKKQASAKATARQKKKVSDMLDVIFRDLRFDVRVQVAQYKNKSFSASALTGDFRLHGTSLDARNVNMNFGRGTLAVNASMKDLNKKVNPVELTAKMTGVYIKDLFVAFDNFGQKTLTYENLYGSINMDAKVNTSVDDDFNVVLPTFNSEVSLTVLNGRLVNFEPLEKMGAFLFKKRDFEDVKFAQINCYFEVKNRDLDIERMEVESTVLTLFLEGKYSLDNRTDLSIQVPLSNLKKRDKSYAPEKVGNDAKVGPSIFLRAQSNEKGETSLSYDPFNKRRKRKG